MTKYKNHIVEMSRQMTQQYIKTKLEIRSNKNIMTVAKFSINKTINNFFFFFWYSN